MRYRVRLPQAAPYAPDPWWVQLGGLLLELVVFLILFLGTPFLIWLALS